MLAQYKDPPKRDEVGAEQEDVFSLHSLFLPSRPLGVPVQPRVHVQHAAAQVYDAPEMHEQEVEYVYSVEAPQSQNGFAMPAMLASLSVAFLGLARWVLNTPSTAMAFTSGTKSSDASSLQGISLFRVSIYEPCTLMHQVVGLMGNHEPLASCKYLTPCCVLVQILVFLSFFISQRPRMVGPSKRTLCSLLWGIMRLTNWLWSSPPSSPILRRLRTPCLFYSPRCQPVPGQFCRIGVQVIDHGIC